MINFQGLHEDIRKVCIIGTRYISAIIVSSWDSRRRTETTAGPGAWEDFTDSAATWSGAPLKKSYLDIYNTTC